MSRGELLSGVALTRITRWPGKLRELFVALRRVGSKAVRLVDKDVLVSRDVPAQQIIQFSDRLEVGMRHRKSPNTFGQNPDCRGPTSAGAQPQASGLPTAVLERRHVGFAESDTSEETRRRIRRGFYARSRRLPPDTANA